MRAWTNSICELARKITDLGGTVSDDELIVVLTNKLPDSYQPLIVSLELVDEKNLTVDYVITRLVNEEDRQGNDTNTEGTALSVRVAKHKTPRSQITCWTCGKKGHYLNECPDAEDGVTKTPKMVGSCISEPHSRPLSTLY